MLQDVECTCSFMVQEKISLFFFFPLAGNIPISFKCVEFEVEKHVLTEYTILCPQILTNQLVTANRR